ncbi:MAG: peptide deformylase [Candidatus Riflebacteria bacterium]|nr:peptide deformylase [Candidatus Riflebacteria bacterium]
MIQKIYRLGDDVLRKSSEPVTQIDDSIRQLAKDMFETMYKANGVGLAAPQIGRNIRLVTIDVESNPIILINPEIKKSVGKDTAEEGCLSVPGLREKVQRANKVIAFAIDLEGNTIEITAEGLMARAIQHEIDHLEGILFIDRISKARKIQIKRELEMIQAGENIQRSDDEEE